MLDCGFCFGFFLVFLCLDWFLLADIGGLECIVAVDDDLLASCAFLAMNSADDDAD